MQAKSKGKKTKRDEQPAESEYINGLRDSAGTKAHSLIFETLPQKCLFLTDLLDKDTDYHFEPRAVRSDVSGILHEGEAKKKRKTETQTVLHSAVVTETQVLSNPIITRLTAKVKKEFLEFVDTLNTLKIWIYLNIPRIEDGNNFGVGVQEDALKEVGHCEDFAFGFLGGITKYYISRAKLITKGLKYPGVADYIEGVHELDEKTYTDLRFSLRELRNNYATLYDLIQKNLEKIEKPRSSHTGAMF